MLSVKVTLSALERKNYFKKCGTNGCQSVTPIANDEESYKIGLLYRKK